MLFLEPVYSVSHGDPSRGGPARVQSTRSSNPPTRSTRSIPSTRSESPVPQGQLEESLDGRSAEVSVSEHLKRTMSNRISIATYTLPTFQPRPSSPRSSLSPDPATDITPQSRAGTPFDTPELSAAEAVADINATNFTIKARLDAIQNGPRPRFVYKVASHPWAKESPDSILRRFLILAGTRSFSMESTTGERFCLSTSCPRESLRKISRRTMMKSSGQRLRSLIP